MNTTSEREANYDLFTKEIFNESSPTFNNGLPVRESSFPNMAGDDYEYRAIEHEEVKQPSF